MKKRDLVPFKKVAAELGVSRWTLWRAARSDIADFPAPIVIRRYVFWKRSDLDRLEEALLMRYQGRCVFDRQRLARKTVAKLQSAKAKLEKTTRKKSTTQAPLQPDLFRQG